MKLKELEFVFENCESGVVSCSDVHYFDVNGVAEKITCNIFGDVMNFKHCEKFLALVNKDIMVETLDGKQMTFLERLQYRDLACIVVHCDEGSDTYYVPWEGDSDYVNDAVHINVYDDRIEITVG